MAPPEASYVAMVELTELQPPPIIEIGPQPIITEFQWIGRTVRVSNHYSLASQQDLDGPLRMHNTPCLKVLYIFTCLTVGLLITTAISPMWKFPGGLVGSILTGVLSTILLLIWGSLRTSDVVWIESGKLHYWHYQLNQIKKYSYDLNQVQLISSSGQFSTQILFREDQVTQTAQATLPVPFEMIEQIWQSWQADQAIV